MAGTTRLTSSEESICRPSALSQPIFTPSAPAPISKNSTATCCAQIHASSIMFLLHHGMKNISLNTTKI